MSHRCFHLVLVALVVLLLTTPLQAAAVIYHYVPAGGPDPSAFRLDQPTVTSGQVVTWFGLKKQQYNCPLKVTCAVSFRHPCTHQQVSVPLALPQDSTPNMEYRTNRVIYDYGSQTVEVHFLKDGTFDVIYNSVLLRAP